MTPKTTVDISLNYAMRMIAYNRAIATPLLTIWAVVILGSCTEQEPNGEDQHQPKISSIGYLKSLSQGTTTAIRSDIWIEGVVVANDRYGEFHKTLIIEDQSAGIAIAIDNNALADKYPFGSLVRVYCNSLYIGVRGGAMEIGVEPTSEDFSVDRIPKSAQDRYIRMVEPTKGKDAQILTIEQACQSRWVNCYVTIKNVRFMESELWCDRDQETGKYIDTERIIEHRDGRQMVVRVAADCIYATSPLPDGWGDVSGIIGYFGDRYSLRVSNRGVSNTGSATGG